jgi:hypothetical protein
MSAELELWWGDACLRHVSLGAGERFVVGAARQHDFVAPVDTHVVSTSRTGDLFLETAGRSRPLAAEGRECVGVGPLVLAVARGSVDVTERFRSPARWLDLGGLALVALYVAFACTFRFPSPRVPARAEILDDQRYLPSAAFGFSIEQEEREGMDAVPRPRRAPATSAKPRAIFAETKARLAGIRPRNQGTPAPKAAADERRGGTGARAKADEGAIGHPRGPLLFGTWAMADRGAPRLAAEDRPRRSWFHGFGPVEPAREDALVAEWEDELEDSGEDESDVVGNMFGDEPIDPLGPGLGVIGREAGGGGAHARRVGTGTQSLGHGRGASAHDGRGVADAALFRRDVTLATYVPRVPTLATRVAPAVVERVLSGAQGRLRGCNTAEKSLEFVIGVDGSVTHTSSFDPCVTRVLSGLRFLPAGTLVTYVKTTLGS